MANTRYLTTKVEDDVRATLQAQHGVAFSKEFLPLRPGGRHEFDAVSTDRAIVASIKTASGRTASGKVPAGKIKDCIAEIYFLSLVEAERRQLILTSAEMHELLLRAMRGKVASGIEIEHIPLTPEVQAEVSKVQRAASAEVIPVLDPTERAALVD